MGLSCDCMNHGSSALLWVAFLLANYIRNTAPSRSDGKMATLMTPREHEATGGQRLLQNLIKKAAVKVGFGKKHTDQSY